MSEKDNGEEFDGLSEWKPENLETWKSSYYQSFKSLIDTYLLTHPGEDLDTLAAKIEAETKQEIIAQKFKAYYQSGIKPSIKAVGLVLKVLESPLSIQQFFEGK